MNIMETNESDEEGSIDIEEVAEQNDSEFEKNDSKMIPIMREFLQIMTLILILMI